jgi:hypothetical protein
VDDFGGGLPGDGVVKFVLYHRVKFAGSGRAAVVVNAALGKDISDLLPDAALAGSNGADALQQLAEVIFAKNALALLEPFVIQHKAFGDKFLQGFGGPNAKPRRLGGIDAVADGNDGVEVVEPGFIGLRFVGEGAVRGGYFQNGNNHFFVEFAFLENVFEVLADGGSLDAKERGHGFLRQPDRFVPDDDVDFHIFLRRAVNEELECLAHGGDGWLSANIHNVVTLIQRGELQADWFRQGAVYMCVLMHSSPARCSLRLTSIFRLSTNRYPPSPSL